MFLPFFSTFPSIAYFVIKQEKNVENMDINCSFEKSIIFKV